MDEIRDAKGLTEAEFLASYSPKNYPRPSLTVDMVIVIGYEKNRGQLLLIQRKGHPYLGCWALPGGFVGPNETAEAAAARELFEETNLKDVKLSPIRLFSTPGRDPRGWTISYAFMAHIPEARARDIQAKDDAAAARWFNFEKSENKIELCSDEIQLSVELCGKNEFGQLLVKEGSGLAFDHAQIIAEALFSS